MIPTIIFMALILFILIAVVSYIVASIEVHNEMRKEKKGSDNSLTGHDWRDFKNDTI